MKLFKYLFLLILMGKTSVSPIFAQQKNSESLYFPPKSGKEWAKLSPMDLGWNQEALSKLYPYLQAKNTKAFIILKDGKMVVEKYFGDFSESSPWYWASAGKTLTAFLIGIAQQEGLLNINQASSTYLGTGFTSLPPEKEKLITIWHQLTMTSGLGGRQGAENCTLPACLVYKADAGSRWFYFTPAYTLLDKVIESASGVSFDSYFKSRIQDKTGISGLWRTTKDNHHVFFSNARSMARFGLLLLNKGTWNGTKVLGDPNYFKQQVSSSQNLNPSYGYLTWLNGKQGFILPGTKRLQKGELVANAPADMFAALGKNDQKIYVIPSKNMVVIRMGESAGNPFNAAQRFDNELWAHLNKVFGW